MFLGLKKPACHIGGDEICPSANARNLGVLIDTELRFKPHVNICIRNAYGNLKMIYQSRNFLSRDVKRNICEALVLSKFNFCDTRRIQVVQNAYLRLIWGIRRRQHISCKLKDTGWLNMSQRRFLHSACMILRNKEPTYLFNKIKFRKHIHSLNVRTKHNITTPKHRTEQFKRSFLYQIGNIYNKLPTEITRLNLKDFKRKLKFDLLR
nr:unnamed protein product [Callosobruchus analis]